MKKYILPVAIISILLTTSCSNETNNENYANETGIDTNIVKISKTECYTYTKNRDTANLTFVSTNGITTGELNYKLYEKDSNDGIIEGEFRGDTLIVDYTFKSEGNESVRQVAFLKKGTQLLEGFGDVEEKNGKVVFKDISKLNFGQSIIFDKIDCK